MKNTQFYAAHRHKYNFQNDFTKKHIKEHRYINREEIPQIFKGYIDSFSNLCYLNNYMTWFAEQSIHYKRLNKMFDG